ncbi:ABC transporter substrate-binding protein [soil metagenome]
MWHALGLSMLFASLSAAAQPSPRLVTLATDDAYPPYSYVANGEAAGLDIALLRRALAALPEWELRLQPRPWARALLEAEQGLVDGFVPPLRNVGREWVALYAGPLHGEAIALSCRAATGLGPASRWPTDFLGKHIGMMRGFLLTPILTTAFAQKQLVKHEFRNPLDALAALATGDIDCYANDKLSIEHAHAQALADPVWAARVPPRLAPAFVLSNKLAYVGFSKRALSQRPELADFARALNTQLARLLAKGESLPVDSPNFPGDAP